MTQILKTIHDDHRNYSILLSMLNTDIDHLRQGVSTDFIRLYDIMNYMTSYPDIAHHPIEEIIFNYLQEKTPEAVEQIDVLISEHRELARLGLSLKEKLQYVTGGAIVSKDAIIQAADEYYNLLTNHINFEESKLLPLIENSFSDEDWETIRGQIEQVEDPLFGDVVEEQFANLFKRLSSVKN